MTPERWREEAAKDEVLDRHQGARPLFMEAVDGSRWRWALAWLRWRRTGWAIRFR